MSTRKSPLYAALAIVISLIVLASGAAKLYRGLNNLSSAGIDPKVGSLLKESDAAIEEANRKLATVIPLFQELLGEFDTLGVAAFRSEKGVVCAKLSEQFASISDHFQEATNAIMEATKFEIDKKTTDFLIARSKSYELAAKANKQNIDIIRATLDESVVDTDSIVQKILAIAKSRDADQKAADEATAASDAILKRS